MICIWCKYGNDKAEEIKNSTFKVLRDSNICSECGKEGISSTFMEKE